MINIVIPWFLGKLTDWEEWDFASTKMKNEVWRSYLAKILNIVIFVLIQMEVASATPFFKNSTIASFDEQNKNGVIYECREDYVAYNFLQLLFSNWYMIYLLDLLWMIAYRFLGWFRKNPDWKGEF